MQKDTFPRVIYTQSAIGFSWFIIKTYTYCQFFKLSKHTTTFCNMGNENRAKSSLSGLHVYNVYLSQEVEVYMVHLTLCFLYQQPNWGLNCKHNELLKKPPNSKAYFLMTEAGFSHGAKFHSVAQTIWYKNKYLY